MLACHMGWPTPYYLRRKVGKGRKPRLDADAIQTIRSHNQLDLALYDWVIERFEREVDSAPFLAQDLRRFQQTNRVPGLVVYGMREIRHRLGHLMAAPLNA